jgi:exodeoxyribonuclease-3
MNDKIDTLPANKQLKIITWNCNMAFRKKANLLLRYKPDILVIPECEHPGKMDFSDFRIMPTGFAWHGENPNKGLGIFSFFGYRVRILDHHNEDFKLIMPIAVSGRKTDFTLFAVWANNPPDHPYQYIGQVWKAIHCYEKLLKRKKVILAGDFNSNTFWDKPKRLWNHSHVVDLLEQKKIYSTYHKFFGHAQGQEKHDTLFMYRHADKKYHIDYCFASNYFINKIAEVKVGTYRKWKKFSDHTPLMVTFDL